MTLPAANVHGGEQCDGALADIVVTSVRSGGYHSTRKHDGLGTGMLIDLTVGVQGT